MATSTRNSTWIAASKLYQKVRKYRFIFRGRGRERVSSAWVWEHIFYYIQHFIYSSSCVPCMLEWSSHAMRMAVYINEIWTGSIKTAHSNHHRSHLGVGRGTNRTWDVWPRWHWQEEETWRKHNLKNFHIDDFANVKCLSCSNVHTPGCMSKSMEQWLDFACVCVCVVYEWLTLCIGYWSVVLIRSDQTIRCSILMAMMMVVTVTCFGISLFPYISLT